MYNDLMHIINFCGGNGGFGHLDGIPPMTSLFLLRNQLDFKPHTYYTHTSLHIFEVVDVSYMNSGFSWKKVSKDLHIEI